LGRSIVARHRQSNFGLDEPLMAHVWAEPLRDQPTA
jgi:hypothetical protein